MSKEKIKKITGSYDKLIISELRDKKMAAKYLQFSLEEYEKDGDTKLFLHALRYVAEAQGGIAKLAQKAKLNRESLYKTLSSRGNPKLQTIGVLLKALGFRLSVKPV
ncbi:MAG TPA: addiction module antidote protein [Coxiellaceae bacterium]|nr:addiction module antidote protein [Coxiellaceae bacterium]